MHPGLCMIFKYILENSEEDCDLLDRAGYYYNMLKNDYEKLREVFEEMRYARNEQQEVNPADTKLEFNTLSILFHKPAEAFIKSYEYLQFQRNKEQMDFEEMIEQQNQDIQIGLDEPAEPVEEKTGEANVDILENEGGKEEEQQETPRIFLFL